MGPAVRLLRRASASRCAGTKNGWGRRARTPITRARTWRPTIRRSPNASAIVRGALSGCQGARRESRGAALEDGGLERAAGLEAGHLGGGNADGLAGTGVAAIALRASAHPEGAEAAGGDPPTPPEGAR